MPITKLVAMGIRVLGVCLLFTVCMAVGASLSGLTRLAPQNGPAPGNIFLPLLVFSLSVGIVVSYLILRSTWHGWTLAGAIFVGAYGIGTVTNQIESIFFLSSKFPPGLLRAIFVQGAIATALFAPLAVLVLGKWRATAPAAVSPAPAPMRASSA